MIGRSFSGRDSFERFPRSSKSSVTSRPHSKQTFGCLEDDSIDTMTSKPLCSNKARQKCTLSAHSRKYSNIPTIYVQNVAYGMKNDLKILFSRYGELQSPKDVVIHGTAPRCYAFVNFRHFDSVEAVLEDQDNIYLGTTKLMVEQSKTSAKSKFRDGKRRLNKNRGTSTSEGNHALKLLQIRNVNRLESSRLDVLQQYLRDENRSSGGELEHIAYNQLCDRVKVKFKDSASLERILNNKLGHKVDGVQLYVSRLTPISKKYVYLHQIPEYLSKHGLKSYLQQFIDGNSIVDIKFRSDNTGALIEFENSYKIDIDQLEYDMQQSVLYDIPFEELGIQVKGVREPDSVLIASDMSSTALCDALEAFLLSRVPNSIDCSVRYTIKIEQSSIRRNQIYWLIFEDYRCVKFFSDSMQIGFSRVSIKKYHDYLGFITDDDDADFIRSHLDSEHRLKLTSLQMKYFGVEKNLDRCRAWLCSNNHRFTITLDSEGRFLKIVSITEQASEEVARMIDLRLKAIVISLDDRASNLLRRDIIIFDNELKRVLGEDYAYDVNDKNVTIVTSETRKMREIADKFFCKSITVEDILNRNILEYKYLKKHQDSIQSFAKGCIIKTSEMLETFYSHGPVLSINLFRQNLETFLKDRRILRLEISRNDLATYLRSMIGKTEIQKIEDFTGAVILDEKDCKIDFDAITPSNGCVLSGVSNNLKISIVCGSASEQRVDCIIDLSDKDLQPCEILAVGSKEKPGDSFYRQDTSHSKRYTDVKIGDIVILNPKNLYCKILIRAMGSWYDGICPNDEILLRRAITNSLHKANELKLNSIALSSMNCGFSNNPSRRAFQIIVDACSSFFHKSVTEMRFVHENMSVINAFIERLKILPGFLFTPQSLPNNTILPACSIKNFNHQPENSSTSSTLSAIKLQVNGCTIEIIEDSIVNVAKNVDVIVNTTGQSILDGGLCSRSIIVAAGSALINDVKSRYSSGLDGIGLAVTVAGLLPCKRLFHISCKSWDRHTTPDQLKEKIFLCLDEAEKLNFTSIAFPAIGAGALGYPVDQVAHIMIDSCQNWLRSRKKSLLQKIALVLFPGEKDCIQAFRYELSAVLEIDKTPVRKMKIGQLLIEIVYGDWVLEKTDAIVYPINMELDRQDSYVMKAFAEAVGMENFESLMANCFKHYANNPDDEIFVIESKDMLQASHIIFADAPWNENENFFWLFDDLLHMADSESYNNICIPFQSRGSFGITVDHIHSLARAFISFGRSTERDISLKRVRILVKNPIAFEKIKQFFGEVKHIVSDDDRIRLSIFEDTLRASLSPLRVNAPKLTRANCDTLSLVLYGTEKQVIDAKEHIARLRDENYSQKIIRSNIVEQLKKYEIEHLEKESQMLNINLKVDRNEKELRIQGSNLETFVNLLRDFLKKFVEYVNCRNNDVKWYKKSNEFPDWTPVETGLFALEMTYRRRKENPAPLHDFESEQNVTVDLNDMVVLDESGSVVWDLKRKEINDNIPLEWDWQPGDDIDNTGYNLVELDKNSKEYEMIYDATLLTDPEIYIFKIERVENPVRYRQYVLARERVARNVAKGLPCERMLFHGTSPQQVPAICADCFDRSMSGVNGVVYGQGSYFHKDFAYSYRYGHGKTVFYCNVLTGNYCVGNPNMKTAPDFDPKRRIRFDSTVNDAANPEIFVVYSDNHAYPSYLITCD